MPLLNKIYCMEEWWFNMAEVRGWKFPIEVNKSTGKIMTVEDNENVKQSIKIILQTQKFERKMRESFGTDINSFMFENIDYSLTNGMTKEVTRSIKRWEEHIEKLSVSVNQSMGDIGSVNVDINFITDIFPVKEKVSESFSSDSSGR